MFGDSAFSAAPFAAIAQQAVNATVAVDGVSATASLGDVSVVAKANVYPTGVVGTTALNSVTVAAAAQAGHGELIVRLNTLSMGGFHSQLPRTM